MVGGTGLPAYFASEIGGCPSLFGVFAMNEITDVEEIYSAEYHRKAGKRGEKQYPAKQDMASAIYQLWGPVSVVDVGCGRGWWMEHWLREHPAVTVIGLDGCADLIKRTGQCDDSVAPFMYNGDLREPGWWQFYTPRLEWSHSHWSIALCIEVAEHLEEQYASGLVRGLCELSDRIFFSSARPGQRGVHHVNCQPKEYWADLFGHFGFRWRHDLKKAWLDMLTTRDQRYGLNIRRNAMFLTRDQRYGLNIRRNAMFLTGDEVPLA